MAVFRGDNVYQLIAESRAESAPAGSSRAPFVGRVAELDLLRLAWRRAQSERGETVIIRGEAGIGKSRLAREFRQSMETTGSRWIEARCLPETHDSALHPIIDLVMQELNLSWTAEGAKRLEAQLRDLRLWSDIAMALLGPWFGLPSAEPHEPLAFSPQRQKALMLNLVVDLLVALGERQVAPIVIEDLHWADPTTLELVDLLIKRVAGTRCLLVLTSRPETGGPWAPEQVQVLDLKSLESADVVRMVEGLAGRDAFASVLVQGVVERADGIPLFAEELVRFIKDSPRPLNIGGRAVGQGEHDVPATLRDLLTGRLDRLGPAKDTAQIAAAIGREFDYRLLAQVVAGDEATLLADLEKMVSADILMRRRRIDSPVYMFRHALIRDAAYESLLNNNKQQLHRRIAETLVDALPELAEAQPELMASHYERAGLVHQSIDEWLRAGKRALDRAANREAILHLRRALALLDVITDQAERLRRELDIQLALAPALMAIQGWASPETGAACTRARDLCQTLGDEPRLFQALWGLWTYEFVGGNLDPALVTAQQTLAIATAHQRPELQLPAHHAMGFSHLYRGELEDARDHGARGVALYEPSLEREIARTFQLNSTGACAYFGAASRWMLGFPADAEDDLAFMYHTARELGHAPSLASAMGYAVFLHHYQQDVERTRQTSDALFALSREQGFQNWEAVSFVYRAWARAKDGDLDQGIEELQRGIAIFRGIGARLTLVGMHAMLGEALLLAKRPRDALVALAEGLEEAETRNEHLCEPELHRLRGEALRQLGDSAAEGTFLTALAVARQQRAHALSLRAALGLSRLWAPARRAEARELLREEYGWFTQGFETNDLLEARTQLAAFDRV